MDWAQVFTMLAALGAAMVWMNSRFNEIEKDITIIKTVLTMKEILPIDLNLKE
jgi:hypothetical protein